MKRLANVFQKFTELFTSKGANIITPQQQGIQFFEWNNVTQWQDITSENIEYYLLNCPPLATIINRKAMAFINGKAEILDTKNGNYLDDPDLLKLLTKPNPIQTDRQFRAQVYSYIQIYGYCPVMVMQPAGFKDYSRVSSLWVIPPNYVTIKTNTKYLKAKSHMDMIDSITFTYNGLQSELDKSSMYIFTDMSTNFDNLAIPDSRLIPLRYPINNIIKNYEARGTIADKRGAIGILSNQTKDNISTLPLSDKDKKQLQADYSRYGLKHGQDQLIITNAALSYQQMAMPVRDMMLLEMETADVMTIADAYGYPSVLLANEKGTTYSNQEGAERKFYQDTIVPESANYDEQLNDMLHLRERGRIVNYDYTWLPSLQEDEKLKAEVRKIQGQAVIQEFQANVITWNEMREGLYLDTVAGMDKYFYELEKTFNNGNDIQPTNSQ